MQIRFQSKVLENCTYQKPYNVFWASNKIISLLDEIYYLLKKLPSQTINHGPLMFHSSKKRNNFLAKALRLLSFQVNDESIVCGLKLVDRLTQMNGFFLTKKNSYKLLVVSIMISDKYLSDSPLSLQQFCRISKISIDDLKTLEIQFLELIDFKIHITLDEYDVYIKKLELNDTSARTNSTTDTSDDENDQ